MASFFRDGYTVKAFIKGIPRLFDDLRFEFRPCLHEERLALDLANPRLNAKELAQRTYKLLAEKVKSWDLTVPHQTTGELELVAISTATIRHLQPVLLDVLYKIVVGDFPPDEDPLQSTEQTEEDMRDKLAASEKGQTFGQARQERQEGN